MFSWLNTFLYVVPTIYNNAYTEMVSDYINILMSQVYTLQTLSCWFNDRNFPQNDVESIKISINILHNYAVIKAAGERTPYSLRDAFICQILSAVLSNIMKEQWLHGVTMYEAI